MISVKPVSVKKLPEKLTVSNADRFYREVASMLNDDRPRIVFDLRDVRKLDSAGVAVLLSCLEEVLKENGDLKLAAVPDSSLEVLRLTAVDRLFEMFDDAGDAVDSFYHIPTNEYDNAAETYRHVIPLTAAENEMAA